MKLKDFVSPLSKYSEITDINQTQHSSAVSSGFKEFDSMFRDEGLPVGRISCLSSDCIHGSLAFLFRIAVSSLSAYSFNFYYTYDRNTNNYSFLILFDHLSFSLIVYLSGLRSHSRSYRHMQPHHSCSDQDLYDYVH